MKFTPRSEQECKELAFSLIDKGTYPGVLIFFQSKDDFGKVLLSKSGNEKTNVRIKVWDIKGKEHTIFDILTDHPQMAYKIRHFAEAFDLIEEYNKGELPGETRIGYHCKIDVGIQKGKDDGKGGFYADKNTVLDYLPSDSNSVETIKNGVPTELPNDDIPF